MIAKVDKDASGCWLWKGGRDRGGYGSTHDPRRTRWLAHRWFWTYANGPIPPGLCVCHRCDNPPCVNPDHLFLGSHADNIADRDAKGRQACGERNAASKLGEDDVAAIRARYATGDVSQYQLADEYGIHQTMVSLIVRRQNWQTVA